MISRRKSSRIVQITVLEAGETRDFGAPVAKAKTSQTSVERRAEELDTIAAVLPLDRRDKLAEILTDQDVETLRHLVNAGMGDNTLRALTSDLAYLEAWSKAATGSPLPWPAPEALLLKFVTHHLWDLRRRETDAEHGMPETVERELRLASYLKAGAPSAAPDAARAPRRLPAMCWQNCWRPAGARPCVTCATAPS